MNERAMDRLAQRLVEGLESAQLDPDRKYGIERLKALGATTFEGTGNPADAEAWMNLLEKCFRVMRCPDDRKVTLAVFLLEKGAEDWWRMVESRQGEVEEPSWKEFKQIFFEKFYPRSFRDAMQTEFLRLVQGIMTVAEYEKRYTELSKYARNIIEDERERCRRFEEGLREEIRTPITASAEWCEFPKLVEAAMRVERSLQEGNQMKDLTKRITEYPTFSSMGYGEKERKEIGKSKCSGFETRSRKKVRSDENVSVKHPGESEASVQGRPYCTVCSRYHWGQCPTRTLTCYRCRQTGHFKRECPLLTQGNVRGQGNSSGTQQFEDRSVRQEEKLDKGKQKMLP